MTLLEFIDKNPFFSLVTLILLLVFLEQVVMHVCGRRRKRADKETRK